MLNGIEVDTFFSEIVIFAKYLVCFQMHVRVLLKVFRGLGVASERSCVR